MIGRGRSSAELGERAIFGDEEAARLRSELEQVQVAVADLTARVHSQFTTIAAHAEIARQQADFARAEARADMERTRETVIGLIEQVRAEARRPGLPAPSANGALPRGVAPAGPPTERLDRLERQLTELSQVVERCFDRQRELADTMASVIDAVFSTPAEAPVAGLSLV